MREIIKKLIFKNLLSFQLFQTFLQLMNMNIMWISFRIRKKLHRSTLEYKLRPCSKKNLHNLLPLQAWFVWSMITKFIRLFRNGGKILNSNRWENDGIWKNEDLLGGVEQRSWFDLQKPIFYHCSLHGIYFCHSYKKFEETVHFYCQHFFRLE